MKEQMLVFHHFELIKHEANTCFLRSHNLKVINHNTYLELVIEEVHHCVTHHDYWPT